MTIKFSKSNRKPASSKLPTPLTISFSNIRGLRSNFSDVESFLYQNSPDILALCETNLNSDIPSDDFLVPGYLPLSRKDSVNHMHGLGLFIHENLPIAREFDLEDSKESFMCFRLSLLRSTSYLYFLYRSPSSQDCSVIQSISESIDKALSIRQSANIFVFGDFNIHHENWLKFSNNTSASGTKAYNFALSQSLSQHVDFPTPTPDRSDQSPSLLDLFFTSNPDICKVSFDAPLGGSNHVVVSAKVSLICQAAHESPIHRTLFSYEQGD